MLNKILTCIIVFPRRINGRIQNEPQVEVRKITEDGLVNKFRIKFGEEIPFCRDSRALTM